MKAQLLRRVCCGCGNEAIIVPPTFVELVRLRSKKKDAAAATTTHHTPHKEEEEDHDALEQAEDDDNDLIGMHRVVVQPSPPRKIAPSSRASSSSSSFSSSSSSFRHDNHRQQHSHESQPLADDDDDDHGMNDTSVSTSHSNNKNNNWAALYADLAVLASPLPPTHPPPGRQDFIARLCQGVLVTKHDRKGHSRPRELYTFDDGDTFSWRAPSTKHHGGGSGHVRNKSSLGALGRTRESYAFGDILEVRRGTVPDPTAARPGETGTALLRASCSNRDLYKSFSLIFRDRTIDFTCETIEEMTFLVKGFVTLSHEQRRKRVRRAGSSSSSGAGVA